MLVYSWSKSTPHTGVLYAFANRAIFLRFLFYVHHPFWCLLDSNWELNQIKMFSGNSQFCLTFSRHFEENGMSVNFANTIFAWSAVCLLVGRRLQPNGGHNINISDMETNGWWLLWPWANGPNRFGLCALAVMAALFRVRNCLSSCSVSSFACSLACTHITPFESLIC